MLLERLDEIRAALHGVRDWLATADRTSDPRHRMTAGICLEIALQRLNRLHQCVSEGTHPDSGIP